MFSSSTERRPSPNYPRIWNPTAQEERRPRTVLPAVGTTRVSGYRRSRGWFRITSKPVTLSLTTVGVVNARGLRPPRPTCRITGSGTSSACITTSNAQLTIKPIRTYRAGARAGQHPSREWTPSPDLPHVWREIKRQQCHGLHMKNGDKVNRQL